MITQLRDESIVLVERRADHIKAATETKYTLDVW
jgi:hypothetical protein